MVNFIAIISIVGTAICLAVYLVLAVLVLFSITRRSKGSDVLPPPDRIAERPWGQQYFERAIGRSSRSK